mgnify:FL=1|jgi:hypothetical protein
MKYFTLKELTRSTTATAKGIDNTPTPEVEKNLTLLVENVLDPLREIYGKPITVNSGYRCPELNKAVGGSKTSDHCFDEKTEILTTKGWRSYNNISKDDILYTYNVDNDIIEKKTINRIVIREYDGDMIGFKNSSVDLLVTDEHRMLISYQRHKYKRKGSRKISEKGALYFDSLKTNNDKFHFELAKDVLGKRRIFKCSSYKNGVSSDIRVMKICLAFICDGFYNKKAIGFRFKKERKIKELEYILNNVGWEYTKRVDKCGVTNFYLRKKYYDIILNIVGKDKNIPIDVLEYNSELLKELLFYYCSYDGRFDKRNNNTGFAIGTTNKHNVDVLQSMACMCGIRSNILYYKEREYNIKGQTGIAKPYYILSGSLNTQSDLQSCGSFVEKYNGVVWCVSNDNETVIVRRNGKVSIQGNCKGFAADITGGSKEENERLFNIIKHNFHFKQLINERDFSWVHVSYDPSNLKNQILKL